VIRTEVDVVVFVVAAYRKTHRPVGWLPNISYPFVTWRFVPNVS